MKKDMVIALFSRARLRVGLCGLCVLLLACAALCTPSTQAQAVADQIPQQVYGPWSAIILPDGPGLTEPAPGPWGGRSSVAPLPASVLAAHAKWTLAFWFNSSDPINPGGLTLLAGIGDPQAKDARFIALVDGRLGAWLGSAHKGWIAADSRMSEGWHFAVATGDGDTVTLTATAEKLLQGNTPRTASMQSW